MTQPLPLQTRVLHLLEHNGPIRAKEIGQWLSDVDRSLLDVTLNALLRANRVDLALGAYAVVTPPRAAPAAAAAAAAAPTAQEEAAASLVPLDYECERCHESQPRAAFRHSKLGKRFKVCRRCTGKDFGVKSAQLERSEGNPSRTVESKLGRRSNSTSENPPSNTPPPPQQGSPEPPAASSELPSAHPAQGTSLTGVVTENTEALPPVGADMPAGSLSFAAGMRRAREVLVDWVKDAEDMLSDARRSLEEFDRVRELINDLLPEVLV